MILPPVWEDFMTRAPLVAAAICALFLGACSNPFKSFAPSEAEVVQQGWYEPSPRPRLAPRYCYETLARVDCFAAPQAGAEDRRVGWFDAPVAD